MNSILFPGFVYLVGFVVYRDLFAHTSILRFWSRLLLYRLWSRLTSLMLLLLLLRLLGYLPISAVVASTPAAQYRPDNTEEEKYSDDPQTPCEDRVSQPPAWLR